MIQKLRAVIKRTTDSLCQKWEFSFSFLDSKYRYLL